MIFNVTYEELVVESVDSVFVEIFVPVFFHPLVNSFQLRYTIFLNKTIHYYNFIN